MAWLEKRNGKWNIAWREGSKIRRRVGYTDKLATSLLLAKITKAQARGEQDAIDKFAPHKVRPVIGVISEYTADLAANNRDPAYVYTCGRRLNKLATFAGWKVLGDVGPDGLRRFRAANSTKLSGKTIRQYAATLKSFCEWCVALGRLPMNPIGRIKAAAVEARRRRRSLNQDEIHRLLTAAPPMRRIVYLTALGTGLRRSELADLIWDDLRLDSPTPHIKLRAVATKARRGDSIAIKIEAADALRSYRPADADPAGRVFPSVPSLARFIRDLDRAGIDHGFDYVESTRKWKRNPDRPQVDFHSTRKTLNTLLLLADVPDGVGMKQMRLTDRRLYDHTYADKAVFDVAAAMSKIPGLIPNPPATEPLAATGTTDDRPGDDLRVANRVARATLKGPKDSLCVQNCPEPLSLKLVENLSEFNKKRLPECGKRDLEIVRHVGLEPTTR